MDPTEIDQRINATHGERPDDIEEQVAHEAASRLRLQRILSEIWTLAEDEDSSYYNIILDNICDVMEREFPPC